MYVVFEGIDGCGKSTQIELLKPIYKDAIFTKEPGGTKFGVEAREILLHGELKSKKAELMLFLADRAEHFEEIIKPNLEKYIFSDRSFLSGIAYAITNEPSLDLEFLISLNRFVLDDTMPEKTILFKISKDELIKRVQERGAMDKIEQRGFEYLLKIQENLFTVAKALELDYLEIDATKSIETIHKEIVEYLQS
jgi:dTMP kinase